MNVCFVSTGFETVGIHFGLISSSFPLRLFKVRIYYILRGYFTGVLTHLNMFRASFPLFLESWVKIENSDLVFSRKNLFIKGVRSQNLKIKQKWEMVLMQDWPVFISNLKFSGFKIPKRRWNKTRPTTSLCAGDRFQHHLETFPQSNLRVLPLKRKFFLGPDSFCTEICYRFGPYKNF